MQKKIIQVLRFPNTNLGAQINLFITIASVAIAIINFVILARLAPVTASLSNLTDQVKASEQQNLQQHKDFVTNTTFNVLVTRIDHISSRVDSIYNIVANLKK